MNSLDFNIYDTVREGVYAAVVFYDFRCRFDFRYVPQIIRFLDDVTWYRSDVYRAVVVIPG